MAYLPVHRCQFDTFGGRCHHNATHAMRSPGLASQTRYYCSQHAEQAASKGWIDVTTIEQRGADSLLGRSRDGDRLLARMGY